MAVLGIVKGPLLFKYC